MKRLWIIVCSALSLMIPASIGLTSCTATRTITTSSSYVQRGDTVTTITSKTVEQYHGKKE